MTEEPLELEFTVECSPEHAFSTWTERISQWWPKGHSVSSDPDLDVVIELRLGGRTLWSSSRMTSAGPSPA